MHLAPIATITPESVNPTARESKLLARVADANHELHEALIELGIINRYEGMPGQRTDVGDLLKHAEIAETDLVWHWKRRAERLEQALQSTLAADLSDADRDRVLSVLYLKKGVVRDTRLLNPCEIAMLTHYRQIDAAGKQILRMLCDKLAGTSTPADETGGAK